MYHEPYLSWHFHTQRVFGSFTEIRLDRKKAFRNGQYTLAFLASVL
jgi:hypothetical protein